MAKNKEGGAATAKLGAAAVALRPVVERAMQDPEFRARLQSAVEEALAASKQAYGSYAKKRNGSATTSAMALLDDKKTQKHLRKALDELGEAGDLLKAPTKKSHKVRNTMLVTGLVVGALYNPWTGPQTRGWITGKIGGDDDLQPLESFEPYVPATGGTTSTFESTAEDTAGAVTDAAADAVET